MKPLRQGKVRDIYDAGPNQLVLLATDRISAFDVVLPTDIPDKGSVLTWLSAFWFDQTSDIAPNHMILTDTRFFPEPFNDHPKFTGRSMLVKKAEVIPIECVARGYLTGGGLKDYKKTGSVCGIKLPSGLVEASKLDEPIFTPTTKAENGHDMPLTFDEVVRMVGQPMANRLRRLTLKLYEHGATIAAESGIIVADTKFEFGLIGEQVVLIDEVLTPDSSRFWPADGYCPGKVQPSFDKQFVRDWLDEIGWDHNPPAPGLPPEVVKKTRSRYIEAYKRLTGRPFA